MAEDLARLVGSVLGSTAIAVREKRHTFRASGLTNSSFRHKESQEGTPKCLDKQSGSFAITFNTYP